MSPSVSERRFIVIGNPGSKRLELFAAALVRLGQPPAQIVSYRDLIAGYTVLTEIVQAGDIVRIESPDRDFAVEHALLARGATEADELGAFASAAPEAIGAADYDNGAILFPRQWYRGYRALLRQIAAQLSAALPHRLMLHPNEIALMFDKPACHALLAAHGLPVPPALDPISSYDELLAQMAATRCWRVFVKLAHGSAASGVIAYRIGGRQHRAITTVEVVQTTEGPRLYNSRRVRLYQDQHEIAALINALCRHRVHVERWLPKAGFQNRTCDLRVMVIGGAAQHVVVRLSRNPMTNLHLSTGPTSGRTTLDALLTRLPATAWAAARHTCERVAALFPQSLYCGIDLLIRADYRRHAVAEVNAFGDLLYGALHQGLDPYSAEIVALLTDQPSLTAASVTPAHAD